eukprot:1888995-Rhodomonas_salina.1
MVVQLPGADWGRLVLGGKAALRLHPEPGRGGPCPFPFLCYRSAWARNLLQTCTTSQHHT